MMALKSALVMLVLMAAAKAFRRSRPSGYLRFMADRR